MGVTEHARPMLAASSRLPGVVLLGFEVPAGIVLQLGRASSTWFGSTASRAMGLSESTISPSVQSKRDGRCIACDVRMARHMAGHEDEEVNRGRFELQQFSKVPGHEPLAYVDCAHARVLTTGERIESDFVSIPVLIQLIDPINQYVSLAMRSITSSTKLTQPSLPPSCPPRTPLRDCFTSKHSSAHSARRSQPGTSSSPSPSASSLPQGGQSSP